MKSSPRPTSAIPHVYYAIFACYEPLLCLLGFIGASSDPKTTFEGQAPWPADNPPPAELSRAGLVTVIQLAHVCFLVGVINHFVLSAARNHLASVPAIQEKVVLSLLTPLLIGDILHLYVTIWALGDEKWNCRTWSPMLWTTIGLGLTLMVPRICWHLGIGRYVHSRDGQQRDDSSRDSSSKYSAPMH
ncbi:MAG: hypothetical protein NXY57DRAFT_692401 [Lentinula lateritia]|uniref:DUF7704 domain-containing protein n=1 Tax=Lentinula lateritia TaxID=40482 RepID=A0ABQ8VQL2_9AGAR|nr:MAG: hypothetical protein NXY57DRAFT_692401 [Lentinula lateritia]KAJ4498681.1 hypothetical protein C8R41DRAFT_817342 [Lentinula lateritia]